MNGTVRQLRAAVTGESGAAFATPAVYSLLDAVYHTAHGYDGGIAALAGRMPHVRNAKGLLGPMSASTLQHKVNPNCTSHHTSLVEARDMMNLTGNYAILHSLCSDLGHVALRLAPVPGMTARKLHVMVKEFGDLLGEVTKAQDRKSEGGRRISPNEQARVRAEAGELINAINALIASVCTDAE